MCYFVMGVCFFGVLKKSGVFACFFDYFALFVVLCVCLLSSC